MDGLISACIISVLGLNKLVLVNATTQTYDVWYVVLLLLKYLYDTVMVSAVHHSKH